MGKLLSARDRKIYADSVCGCKMYPLPLLLLAPLPVGLNSDGEDVVGRGGFTNFTDSTNNLYNLLNLYKFVTNFTTYTNYLYNL